MKSITILKLLAIILVIQSTQQSVWKDEFGPPRRHEWEVVPEATDEFEATQIDEQKWMRFHPYFSGNRPTYYWKDNSYIKQGQCVLATTDLGQGSNQDYRNGYLRAKKDVKYGYIEIMAKTQRNDATTAFWLYAWKSYATYEIDIFEVGGKQKGMAHLLNMNHHYFEGNDVYQNWGNTDSCGTKYPHNEDIGADYHAYGLEWDEEYYRIYFDGQLIKEIKNDYFHIPMRVQMTTEFHPSWFGTVEKDELPSYFKIKWIRTYKKKGHLERCSGGLYRQFQDCQNQCNAGYYADSQKVCHKCHYSCVSCTGSWLSDCTVCADGYSLQGNKCKKENPNGLFVPRCKDGKYLDAQGNCQQCHFACSRCTGPTIDECSKCNSQYISDVNSCVKKTGCSGGQVRQRDVCQASCDSGFHANNAGICMKCHPTCKSCSGFRDNQCLSCEGGYTLSGGVCVSNGDITCQPNQVLQGSVCQASCDIGYYEDNKICKQCSQNCTRCSGPNNNQCTECVDGYKVQQNQCVEDIVTCTPTQVKQGSNCQNHCNSKYYPDSNKICQQCHNTCLTCSGPNDNQCLSCETSTHYLSSNQCLLNGTCPSNQVKQGTVCQASCNQKYYPDTNRICQQCESTCQTCSGPNNNQCQSCNISTHYLHQTTCLLIGTCPSNQVKQGSNCQNQCDQGYYPNVQKVCESCSTTCKACNGANSNQCTQCESTHYLHSSKQCIENGKCAQGEVKQGTNCQSSCNQKYYADSQQVCQSCDPSCQTCEGPSSSQCLSCRSNFSLQQGVCVQNDVIPPGCVNGQVKQGSNCQQSCNEGYYADSNNICQQCDPHCKNCSGPYISHCTECHEHWSLTTENKCVGYNLDCSYGQYKSTSDSCEWCDSSCANCFGQGPWKCTECPLVNGSKGPIPVPNFNCGGDDGTGGSGQECTPQQVKQGNKCQQTCDIGYYADADKICQECNKNCKRCTGPYFAQCTECYDNWHLVGSKCWAYDSSDCGYGKYRNDSGSCQFCDSTCLHCFGEGPWQCSQCHQGSGHDVIPPVRNNCGGDDGSGGPPDQTQCQPGQVKQGQNCQQNCDIGYYADSSNVCQQCHASCKSCSGASLDKCTECQTGKKLQGNVCQQNCDNGYYADSQNICQQCHITCAQCNGSGQNQCTQCSVGKYLQNNTCQQSCDIGYYSDINNVCQQCHSTCTECTGASLDECTDCQVGLKLQGNVCQQNCDNGYYSNAYNICQQCHTSCAECNGSGQNQCTSCSVGKYLQNNTCQQSCDSGYYSDSQNICQQCHSTCTECDGSSQSQCTQCPVGQFLHNGQCKSNCNSGYYSDSQNNCQLCHTSCAECNGSSQNQCTECPVGQFLQDNTCQQSCNSGFYADTNNVCQQCHGTCQKCSGPNADQCQDVQQGCPQGQVKQSGNCQATCSEGYYADVDSICQKCYYKCKQCTDACIDKCTACYDNWVLGTDSKCYAYNQSECGKGQYRDSQGGCKQCDSSCENCFGGQANQCTQCTDMTVAVNNTCETSSSINTNNIVQEPHPEQAPVEDNPQEPQQPQQQQQQDTQQDGDQQQQTLDTPVSQEEKDITVTKKDTSTSEKLQESSNPAAPSESITMKMGMLLLIVILALSFI